MSWSHVTHLMSRSHVTHHISFISCHSSHVTHHISLISCLITKSLISYLDLISLFSCLIITSLGLASRDNKRVMQRFYQRVQKMKFAESIGSEPVNHMSLITRHSSHVTHPMSHHYVNHLMSLISCLDPMSHNYVTHLLWLISCLDLMSLISCLDLMSLITCHSSHVTHLMSLITCHSSHVTHLMSFIACQSSHVTHLMSGSHVTQLMSRSYVTHHMSLISCHSSHVSISCHLISCLIITSLITCHSSHVSISCRSSHVTDLMSHHYLTHLVSHHYVTDAQLLPIYSRMATFNFCQWPLPTSHRIILPVTCAHPLRSNLCPLLSVHLPRKIGIGFQDFSHSSQSRSHVTHLMSYHYVTQPGLKG